MKNKSNLTIEQIVEIDDEAFKILETDAGKVFLAFKDNKLEKTGRVLTLFHSKVGFIKNGIYDQLESKNLYVCKILYRTLIEHYLKSLFILLESAKLGIDTIANEYYEFADVSEKIHLGSAYKKAGEILYPKKTFGDLFEVLKEMYPKLRKYSKKHIQEKTSKFTYKSIIKTLYGYFYIQRKEQGTENNFLINLIPEYSDLSSYVHGTPAAEETLLALSQKGEEALDHELVEIFYKTIMLSTHLSSMFYMFAIKFDNKYKEMFVKIENQLQILLKLKQKS